MISPFETARDRINQIHARAAEAVNPANIQKTLAETNTAYDQMQKDQDKSYATLNWNDGRNLEGFVQDINKSAEPHQINIMASCEPGPNRIPVSDENGRIHPDFMPGISMSFQIPGEHGPMTWVFRNGILIKVIMDQEGGQTDGNDVSR